MEPTSYVLCPRTRGYSLLLSSIGDSLTYVYDLTIVYTGHTECVDPCKFNAPDLYEFTSNVDIECHLFLRRYCVSDLKKFKNDDEFVLQLFQDKDKLMKKFYKFGAIAMGGDQAIRVKVPWMSVVFTFLAALGFLLIPVVVGVKVAAGAAVILCSGCFARAMTCYR